MHFVVELCDFFFFLNLRNVKCVNQQPPIRNYIRISEVCDWAIEGTTHISRKTNNGVAR